MVALHETGGVWQWQDHGETVAEPTFWDTEDPGTGQCGVAECTDPR